MEYHLSRRSLGELKATRLMMKVTKSSYKLSSVCSDRVETRTILARFTWLKEDNFAHAHDL